MGRLSILRANGFLRNMCVKLCLKMCSLNFQWRHPVTDSWRHCIDFLIPDSLSNPKTNWWNPSSWKNSAKKSLSSGFLFLNYVLHQSAIKVDWWLTVERIYLNHSFPLTVIKIVEWVFKVNLFVAVLWECSFPSFSCSHLKITSTRRFHLVS